MLDLIIANYREILLNTARIFSSVFEILLFYLLANSFYTPKIKNKNFDFLPYFLLAGTVVITQETGLLKNGKYLLEAAALIIFLFFLYNGSVKKKLLGAAVFAAAFTVSILISQLVFTLISQKNGVISDYLSPFSQLLRLTVSNVLMIAFSILISIFGKVTNGEAGALRLWLELLSVPVITLITFSVYQYYIEAYPNDQQIISYIYISCVGLVFINLLVFILFWRLNRQMNIKRENDILTSQLSQQAASVKRLESAYNRTRSFRHDIKNHILLMQMLAERGCFEELKSYIGELRGIIDESSYVRISGISAVDAILNEKLYEAQAKAITTSFDVVNLDKNNIKPLDLCIILSNALDNAIEANEKIENPDERYIKLKIHGNEAFCVLSVSNPANGAPVKDKTGFLTSKPDAENHGFGLKSIKSAVQKYKGEMLCKCEDGVFTLVIRLRAGEAKD